MRPETAVKIAVATMSPLITGLAVLGAIGSFATVRSLATPWFGGWAWIVPIGVDIGILALLGWDLLAEYLRLPWPVLHWTAWGFIASTVYLNVAAAHGNVTGSIMHAAMPALFITVIEGIRHLIRQWTGLAAGVRIERIPAPRWLLAPRSSFLLARHMVLWHVTSYRQGLHLEYARLMSISRLKETHGRLAWRWRAPLRERLALHLPAEDTPVIPDARASLQIVPPSSPAAGESGGTPAAVEPPQIMGSAPPLPANPPGQGSHSRDHYLITAAREIIDDARLHGVRLSQAALAKRLRSRGHRIANDRLRWLVTETGIKTEREAS
jgi:hypothetical protein